MRNNYWSCTTLADKIRGTTKPTALGWDEWDSWKETARQKHPVRYWIAETLLDNIQSTIWWIPDRIRDIRWYIHCRWISRPHMLIADRSHIRPGTWCDFGDRILPCLFEGLVLYVERDCAHRQRWSGEGTYRFKGGRCKQAGLDYLNWEASLRWEQDEVNDPASVGQPTPQAITAQKVLELYRWWTQTRPLRGDPYEVSGWSSWCSQNRGGFGSANRTPSENKLVADMLEHMNKLELEYEAEDTKQLQELISIRRGLWR